MGLSTWDRLLLWSSLALVTALAWMYLFLLDGDMASMSSVARPTGEADATGVWNARHFSLMFLMWAVMMVGMMVPTAVRAIFIYCSVAKTAVERSNPIASTYSFLFGYVLVWTFFSLGATVLQASFNQIGLLTASMTISGTYAGAALLILAGIYQLTPWKNVCLKHCQSPATYLAGRFGPRPIDGIRLGVQHGAYCIGCCWFLMTLLFVGGVMNLLWIAAIAGFVLAEKLLPPRFGAPQVAATVMIAAGILYPFYR